MLPNIVQIVDLLAGAGVGAAGVRRAVPLAARRRSGRSSHFLRAIGLTLLFHRYLAHRAFKMNRVARFVWAFIGTAAMQKGPLWWAGHHVNHHQLRRSRRRSAQPDGQRLLLRAHRLVPQRRQARHARGDQSGDPRLLEGAGDRAGSSSYFFVPPLLLAVAMYLIGGLPWLVWGFCLPTMTLAHATFAINTVNHMFGSRRFETIDESRNNAFTAFFAVGEGWHNNHHRYQRAARNGFYWWEFDPTWYVIRLMQMVGLVWDVQPVPERIYEEARVAKARRASQSIVSVVHPTPIGLELAEDVE